MLATQLPRSDHGCLPKKCLVSLSLRLKTFFLLWILRPLVTLSFLTKLWGLISGSWLGMRSQIEDRQWPEGRCTEPRELPKLSLVSAVRTRRSVSPPPASDVCPVYGKLIKVVLKGGGR